MTIQNSLTLQIRKIIFENFNDLDTRFNNDQILELLRKTDGFDQTMKIDDLETEFKNITDSGLIRCIAQNFTTQWFKLYDDIEEIYCDSCSTDIFLGKDESRICPNPQCNANL